MAEPQEYDRLFPESFLKELDESHDVQARLNYVDALLREDRLDERLRDMKEDPKDGRERLIASRAELLERVQRIDQRREERRKPLESAVLARVIRGEIRTLPDPVIRYPPGCAPSEGSVPVPVFLEGTQVLPGSGASGAILTLPTTDPWEAPEPHCHGDLSAGSFLPGSPKYWLHNWRYVIPFPCVPCDGRLTYSVYFEVGGLYRANAWIASLQQWINVRGIPDVSAGIDFSALPDFEVWPTNRSWFLASFMLEPIWDGVTLQGSMSVQRGKAAVLAVIVGIIVGVGGGRFTIFNSGFHPWEMQRFPPGGSMQPWDIPFHARVHYKYVPSGGVFFP